MSETGLVKSLEGQILGPESSFAVARTERRKEWQPVAMTAMTAVVTDAASKELAVGYGRLLQASEKELAKLYTDTKRMIDDVKKPILDAEKADMGQIKEAKDALSVILLKYNKEQERIHQEAVRKAQEEARKAAEEQKLAEAIAAEAAGEKEEAEAIINEPTLAPASIVQKPVSKVAGEVGKKTYQAKVDDLMKLVKAVAAGTVPILAIKADEPWLNGQARAFREGLNYPGVSVTTKEGVHFRS